MMKAKFRNAATLYRFNVIHPRNSSIKRARFEDIITLKFSHTENNCIDVTRGEHQLRNKNFNKFACLSMENSSFAFL